MTPTTERLHDPELRTTLGAALAEVALQATPDQFAAVAIACVEGHLSSARLTRRFLPAHLGVVFLLAEQQEATHSRLRRLWEAKASRAHSPWPWISESGLRTRCSELVAWGLVESAGQHGTSPSGRPAKVWSLLSMHPAQLGREVLPVPGVDEGVRERLDELLVEAGDDVIIRSRLQLAAEVAGVGTRSLSIDLPVDVSGFVR